jgi:glycosyltransferase involved in cell wall biosynthesis
MKISIVIPVFNEANDIESILCELEKHMFGYLGIDPWEIIVVNDGSTDNTLEKIKHFGRVKKWLNIIDMASHYGRGRALRAGLRAAKGDIIVSMDADLSYAPYHINRMVDKITGDNADIVLASAYGKNGTVKNVPIERLWISIVGNKILSWMFGGGLTVLTCLVRAYDRDFIQKIDLHSDDKEVHLEILYKARMLGGKIAEVPADLCWRKEKMLKQGKSKTNNRRSTMRFKKTSNSHLFFALLNRPGFIFWVPGSVLVSIAFLIMLVIMWLILIDVSKGVPLYFAIRSSMMNAMLSWFTMAVSFILGVQFFTLGFLTSQNKRNYEEIYKTLHAIFGELKSKKD